MKVNRKISTTDWLHTIIRIGIFVVVATVSAVIFLPMYWYIWIGIVICGIYLLIDWHAKNFAYFCSKCKNTFSISFFTDFTSLNGLDKKYLKCPKCRERMWVRIVRK